MFSKIVSFFRSTVIKPSHLLVILSVVLVFAGLVAWGSLALYWSNLPWWSLRLAVSLAFAVFGIWALWLSRRSKMRFVFAGVFLVVLAYWWVIPASHQRLWQTDVAVMPHADIDGDRILLRNVRNFKYQTLDDFTVKYEDREVFLSHLTGVDFFISYWMKGPVGHTFLSFTFDNAPPLSISIETRPESHEGFHPLASMFKQFELIYVMGDEQDIVGVRTNHRKEDVFLYPVRVSAEGARALFLIYLERINELAAKPEWYNLLSNNCTLNIVRYANRAGRVGEFNIRHLLNGWIDTYLYHAGFLDTDLPFEEFRQRSHINAAAQAAEGDPDFSAKIRAGLPIPPARVASAP
ncbi:DUF4105 domain-containing protein [Deefgea tanakiae]|uniref:DUF4105 domain-containing protein n=1 Tax=Deefgea tanakiae TaxID=2865840 RepID=A0ABX8Z3R4_9NEIS|nr:DUF4105 domain-containing protein [Deefgea tanakiae]QZA77201.1 DUF4105 domain-containing protein [Deefgea tanakiae]